PATTASAASLPSPTPKPRSPSPTRPSGPAASRTTALKPCAAPCAPACDSARLTAPVPHLIPCDRSKRHGPFPCQGQGFVSQRAAGHLLDLRGHRDRTVGVRHR